MGAKGFLFVMAAIALSPAIPATTVAAEHPAIVRADKAIASGKVDPGRDLAPLVEALRGARNADDQRAFIEAAVKVGAGSGSSPATVKKYLLERSTPVLLDLARRGANVFVKGDAMLALRDMAA